MTLKYRHKDETLSIHTSNVDKSFIPWLDKARERIFSLAAGDRVGKIAPQIMEIGLAKVLYSANELGVDIESAEAFCLFAPDGTVSYNPIRTKRGFSYGCILNFNFDGLIATNNSMPNGCGFSIYELENPPEDSQLLNFLSDAQMRLGQDQLSQLGKGNHFAGLYYVLDPLSGEDTGRRFVVIHCSGHVGVHKLYHPESWLMDFSGYHDIKTPHGPITLMEEDAKINYLEQFAETDKANSDNRDTTMSEIFDNYLDWKKLEGITHQGLKNDGIIHIIGTQIHDGMVPVAFNPEEGLIAVRNKPNLTREFLDQWDQGDRVKKLNLVDSITGLNFTPHGGGYEFKHPIRDLEIKLNKEGIDSFTLSVDGQPDKMSFTYFREIREWMTYRRKAPVIQEIAKADLASIEYEMPCLMQIYPLVSIPGGSH